MFRKKNNNKITINLLIELTIKYESNLFEIYDHLEKIYGNQYIRMKKLISFYLIINKNIVDENKDIEICAEHLVEGNKIIIDGLAIGYKDELNELE